MSHNQLCQAVPVWQYYGSPRTDRHAQCGINSAVSSQNPVLVQLGYQPSNVARASDVPTTFPPTSSRRERTPQQLKLENLSTPIYIEKPLKPKNCLYRRWVVPIHKIPQNVASTITGRSSQRPHPAVISLRIL
ncbi:GM11178 [Drosophila sechellia]|uniref:GM11178 n=1 Tax=Drosophila sechellia TaxID=7238 RepID=B4INW7_DROSE|nr:GM11178 [Drosophila sechellia]